MRRLALRRPLVALFALAAFALAAPRASARHKEQPKETAEQEVQRLANEAVEAYKRDDYDRAVKILTRAYAIRPVPDLLYNLAKAQDKAGNVVAAYENYQKYVQTGDNDSLKEKANARLAALQPDYTAKTAPPKPVEPPPAEPPKTEPPKTIIIQPTGPTPEEIEAKRVAEEQAQHAKQKKMFIGLGVGAAAVGLAGIGAGIGLYFAASSDQSSFSASRDETQKRQLRDDAQSLGVYSTVGYIVGGVFLAGSAALFYFALRPWHPSEAPKVALAPWLSPTGGGGMATWRW